MRTPRQESLCYGQISACRGANRKNLRNNWPILRWDQRSFRWFMLDRVKLCTLETFGDSVATASFLRCKFRSFSPRFSSVIGSLSLFLFGVSIRCQKQSFCIAMKSFIFRQIVRLCNFRQFGRHRQFSSVQVSLVFASVFFGDSLAVASFLR